MKIFRILLAAAIVLGMTACNNEDPVDLTAQPESTVSVRVVPTSDVPAVRAIGDLSLPAVLAAESAIKQLEVYIFQGQLPDGYKSVTGTNVTQVLDIATHAGVRTIVVVANANIGTVENKAELLAETKDLPVGDITTVGLLMTSNETSVELVAGKNQYGFANGVTNFDANAHQLSPTALPLVRVNARVAIVSAVLDLTPPPAGQFAIFDALTDIQVAMFNVPKTSKLFGAPLAMNSDFLFGEAWPSPLATYHVGTANAAFKEIGPSTLPITVANAPYFYVTENNSTTAKDSMFIVLRAKPTKGNPAVPVVSEGLYTDADGYTYYPVWVNATKAGYSYTGNNTGDGIIRRNTQYNISLKIKKIGNPTIDPPVAAQLDVNVSVEPWLVVTQGVEW